MRTANLQIFRDARREWRRRLRASNGRIVADSGEEYRRRAGRLRGRASIEVHSGRRRVDRGGEAMIRKLIPFLIPSLLLTGCVCTIYVPHGTPVRLRETVKDVKSGSRTQTASPSRAA